MYYLRRTDDPATWPFKGRGYNSGVVVMDLPRLRESWFAKEWREIFREYSRTRGEPAVADQVHIKRIFFEKKRNKKNCKVDLEKSRKERMGRS